LQGHKGYVSRYPFRCGTPSVKLSPRVTRLSFDCWFPAEWGGAMTGPLSLSPRGRIYNLTITDAVDCEIIDAEVELSPGRY
jgi:hypothetical protein